MCYDHASMGKASLWTAISGIVLLLCLAIVIVIQIASLTPHTGTNAGLPIPASKSMESSLVAGGILFMTLELIAITCGIKAMRTPTGKGGLAISAILLSFVVCLIGYTLYIAKWSW